MNNNNSGRLPPLPSGLPPLHSQPINIPHSTAVTTSAGRGYYSSSGTTMTTKNETTITTNNVGRGMMGQPTYPAPTSNMLGRGSQNNNLPPLPALPQLNQNHSGRQAVPQQRYNNQSSHNITPYSDAPTILNNNQKPDERGIFEAKF